MTTPRSIPVGPHYRNFSFTRDQVDTDARTVELTFSSETPVERWWGMEILDHSPLSARLERLNAAGALLIDHDSGDQVGVVEKASIGQDRKGHATVRFGKGARAEEIFQDVVDGIRRSTSVGYRVYEMILESETEGLNTYRARDWEPFEISITAIPADTAVGVGRHDEQSAAPCKIITPAKEERTMETCTKCGTQLVNGLCPACTATGDRAQPAAPAPQPAPAPATATVDVRVITDNTRNAEITRIRELTAIGEKFDMRELAQEHIIKGTSLDEFRKTILDAVSNAKPIALPDLNQREQKDFSIRRAVAALAGLGDRSGLEFEVSDDLSKLLGRKTEGIFIPLNLRAALSTSATGTEKAGYTIQTTLQPLIEILRNRMIVRQMGATVLSVRGPIAFPRQTGTSTLYWTGEAPASDVPESEAAFEQIVLSPKSAMATTAYTKQLLMESSIDIENFVRNDLTQINALGLDLASITGTGSANQPKGVLLTDNIGIEAGGTDGAVPTWSNIVNLETKVAAANADMGSLGYLTNTKVRGKMKQTLKAANVPGFIWENVSGAQPGFGEMNGYKAGATNQVPSNLTKGAANGICSALVFGDWSSLIIVDFGIMEMTVDPYSQKKKGLVEVTSLVMVDIGVRHPEAFAAMKDALTQ